jgi:hypothetical protein
MADRACRSKRTVKADHVVVGSTSMTVDDQGAHIADESKQRIAVIRAPSRNEPGPGRTFFCEWSNTELGGHDAQHAINLRLYVKAGGVQF